MKIHGAWETFLGKLDCRAILKGMPKFGAKYSCVARKIRTNCDAFVAIYDVNGV